jgi:hypothetical protein
MDYCGITFSFEILTAAQNMWGLFLHRVSHAGTSVLKGRIFKGQALPKLGVYTRKSVGIEFSVAWCQPTV